MTESEATPLLQGKKAHDVTHVTHTSQSGGSSKKPYVTLFILMTELCERMTYYSIVSNQVLFCTNFLNYQSVDAVTINLIFQGKIHVVLQSKHNVCAFGVWSYP